LKLTSILDALQTEETTKQQLKYVI